MRKPSIIDQPFFKKGRRYVGASSILTSVTQRPWVQSGGFKPSGLWYSGGNDWWRWMQYDAQNLWGNYVEVHEIEVDESKVLSLKTVEAVRAFHSHYRISMPGGDRFWIDWRKVERRVPAGIEIIPYQWSLRLSKEVAWYYPWDAASGCIWDISAITGIQHVGTLAPLPSRDSP